MVPTATVKQENSSPVTKMETKPLRTIQTQRMTTGGKVPRKILPTKAGEKKKAQSAFHLWISEEENREVVLDYYKNAKRTKNWHIFKKAGQYWHLHLAKSVVEEYQKKYREEKAKEEAEKNN